MTAPVQLLTKSPAERLKPGRPLTLDGVPDGAEGLVLDHYSKAAIDHHRAR